MKKNNRTKKYFIFDEIDFDGKPIPGTAKRYTREEREEMYSDNVAGELIFDEKGWLGEQIQTLQMLKQDITANKYKVPISIIQYMAVCNDVISHFMEKQRKASDEADAKRELGLKKRTKSRDKFQKHFDAWRTGKDFPSDLKLFTAYRRSKDVQEFYKKNKRKVPAETTLTDWIK